MHTLQMPFDLEKGADEHSTLQLPDAQIQLFSHYLSSSIADSYYQQLFKQTPWQQDRLNFAGKSVLIPRLQAWYGDVNSQYGYSGLSLKPHPWTELLLGIKKDIEKISASTFNSVLINYYRDGQDSVAWHSDDEKELGEDPIIASLSLGACRRFEMKHRTGNFLKSSCDLTHGSLMIMGKGLQQHWHHQVPKQKEVVSGRINLTFRKIL